MTLSQQILGISPTVFAFGTPDDAVHGANERFSRAMFHKGIRAYVLLLQRLGAAADGGADAGSPVADVGSDTHLEL